MWKSNLVSGTIGSISLIDGISAAILMTHLKSWADLRREVVEAAAALQRPLEEGHQEVHTAEGSWTWLVSWEYYFK